MVHVFSSLAALTATTSLLAVTSVQASEPTRADVVNLVLTEQVPNTESFRAVVGALDTYYPEPDPTDSSGRAILSTVCGVSADLITFVPQNSALPPTSAFGLIDQRSLASFVKSHVVVSGGLLADLGEEESTFYGNSVVNATQIDLISGEPIEAVNGNFYLLEGELLAATVPNLLQAIFAQSYLGDLLNVAVPPLNADLLTALGGSSLTLFLPDRAAFVGAFHAYPDLLIEPLADGTNTLSNVLLAHATVEEFTGPGVYNMVDGSTFNLAEADLSGEVFPFAIANGASLVGITKVIGAAELAGTATETTLLGPVSLIGESPEAANLGTIVSLVTQDPSSSTFGDFFGNGKSALSSIVDAYRTTAGASGRTILAPVDAAFAALGDIAVALTTLPHNFPVLGEILLNHVSLEAAPLNGTITTLGGAVFNTSGDNVVDTQTGSATTSVLDDTDTVIVIDEVLVPQALLESGRLGTIVDVVTGSPDHTLLAAAVGHANLVNALSAVGETAPVVLAPTDAAFTAFAVAAGLISEGETLTAAALTSAFTPEELAPILLQHVVTDVQELLALAQTNALSACNVPDVTLTGLLSTLNGAATEAEIEYDQTTAEFTLVNAASGPITLGLAGSVIQRVNGAVISIDTVIGALVTEAPTTMPTNAPTLPTRADIVNLVLTEQVPNTESFRAVVGALDTYYPEPDTTDSSGSAILSTVCSAGADLITFVPQNSALPPTSAFGLIDQRSLASFVKSHVVVSGGLLADLGEEESTFYGNSVVNATQIDLISGEPIEAVNGNFYLLEGELLAATVPNLLQAIFAQSYLGDLLNVAIPPLNADLLNALLDSSLTLFLPDRAAFVGAFHAYPDLLIEPLADGTNTLSNVLLAHATVEEFTGPGVYNMVDGSTFNLAEADLSGEVFPFAIANGASLVGITKVIGAAELAGTATETTLLGPVSLIGESPEAANLGTIVSLVTQDPSSSTFGDFFGNGKSALASIVDAYRTTAGASGRTILAPVDAAFAALGDIAVALTTLPHNFPVLGEILLNHVSLEAALLNETITTLGGTVFNTSGDNVVDTQTGSATTSVLDDTDAVIVIDEVLVPQALLESGRLGTIVDVVTGSPDHTLLAAAVGHANLVGALSAVGETAPVVLAPTDAAFTAFAVAAGLISEGETLTAAALTSAFTPEELAPILLQHVVTDVQDLLALAQTNALSACNVPGVKLTGLLSTLNAAAAEARVEFDQATEDFTLVNAASGPIALGATRSIIQRVNGAVISIDTVIGGLVTEVSTTEPPTEMEEESSDPTAAIIGGVVGGLVVVGVAAYLCSRKSASGTPEGLLTSDASKTPNPSFNPTFEDI